LITQNYLFILYEQGDKITEFHATISEITYSKILETAGKMANGIEKRFLKICDSNDTSVIYSELIK